MNPRLEFLRKRLWDTPDTVCLERARLVTEGYQRFADDPLPIKRARTLAQVLEQMTIWLDDYPFLAGNMSSAPRAWMLLPEYGFTVPAQAVIEHDGLDGFLDGEVIPADLRDYWRDRSFGGGAGIGHLAVNNRQLVHHGLDWFIAQAEAGLGDPDPEKKIYRQAMVIACRAVINWAQRYADHALEIARGTASTLTAMECERLAETCRQVPAGPARTLREGLQSILLVHYAMHLEGHGYSVSPGRLDQDLAGLPCPEEDDPVDLFGAFMLKVAGNAVWGSHSKTQAITIGGRDQDGRDLCNEHTLNILKACELVRTPDPTLFVRWHRNLAPEIKRQAVRMLGDGLSLPLLIGDETTAAGLQHAGLTPADAWNYCVIGCNELGVPGRLMWESVGLPELQLLRQEVLNAESAPATTEDLLQGLQQRARTHLQQALAQHRQHLQDAAARVPTPFTTALMDDGIATGRDLHVSLPYRHVNLRSSGFANVINALAAIDSVVMQRPECIWGQLLQALEHDFAAAEPLRQQLLDAPKWGNDNDEVDPWATRWQELRERVLADLMQNPECPPLLMEMVVRSLHHLEGRSLGATPDGRHAGEPLADSIGAVLGMAAAGPTAILNSVRRLQPQHFWPGGYNLNLTLPAAIWQPASRHQNLQAMVETFFAEGGQELQLNCLDAEVLKAAQQQPENYPDLLVRISGFNARFVTLSRLEQAEIIRRAECATS